MNRDIKNDFVTFTVKLPFPKPLTNTANIGLK